MENQDALEGKNNAEELHLAFELNHKKWKLGFSDGKTAQVRKVTIIREIWKRWEAAFRDCRTTPATHPALPEDRARWDELSTVLKRRLVIEPDRAVVAHARFDWNTEGDAWGPLRVHWRPHEHGA